MAEIKRVPEPEHHGAPDPKVLAAIQGDVRKGRLKRAASIVLAVFIVAGIGFWIWRRASPPVVDYETQAVERADFSLRVTATGTLEPKNAVDVGADTSGRVKRVLVDVNDTVTQGQLLAELQTDLSELAVKQASAAIATAEASRAQAQLAVDDAQLAMTRANKLRASHAISDAEFDQQQSAERRAQAMLKVAQANVEVARAAFDTAKANRGKAEIRTPMSGIVLRRNVEPGQVVISALQAQVLFRVAEDLAHLQVRADIDEAYVGQVREGMDASFSVSSEPQRTFDARVRSVTKAPRPTQLGGSQVVVYEALLDVDNADLSLRPGMTATVKINTGELKNATLVPGAALRFVPPSKDKATPAAMAGASRVYLLADGVAVPKDVKVLASDSERAAVSGLQEGDRVIVAAKARK